MIPGFAVTMRQDISEEHARMISDALRLLDGVVDVRPVEIGVIEEVLVATRVNARWREALWEISKKMEER